MIQTSTDLSAIPQWDPASQYVKGAVVIYNGKPYLAACDNTNTPPSGP
jgi:hypothetical protein